MSSRIRIAGEVYDLDDYTFYVYKDSERQELLNELKDVQPLSESSWSCDAEVTSHRNGSARGRAMICKCHRGQALSITLRRGDLPASARKSKRNSAPWQWSEQHDGGSQYEPSSSKDGNVFSIEDICNELFELVFIGLGKGEKVSGLLVISGATASAKSQVARGLIYMYLRNQAKKHVHRRQHLVTFEDPIEKPFRDPAVPVPRGPHNVDYTAREKGTDIPDKSDQSEMDALAEAFHDAKRQTPSVYYVGEIRNHRDWRNVIEFAGSGHLVVTTSHAGSLVEAIAQIFLAVSANNPAQRGYVAQRILAVVHQVTTSISTSNANAQRAILPALWRQEEMGVKAIISDGLGSVLPCNPATVGHCASFGRLWFAEQLCQRTEPLSRKARKIKEELLQNARRLDIRGV
jgi:hypothetical protein